MPPTSVSQSRPQANGVGSFPTVEGRDLTPYIKNKGPFTIGCGAFTDIFKGEYHTPGSKVQVVVIKIFRGVHTDKKVLDTMNRYLRRESHVWNRLRHRNILQYLGFCDNKEISPSVALIAPFCEEGTIATYLEKNPDADRSRLVSQIAAGLKYLHDEGIIHGDLSGNNVLVSDDGEALLADFGRAKVVGTEGYSTKLIAGCTEYMAPELHDLPANSALGDTEEEEAAPKQPLSKMSDVYAFAMVAFQVFTNRTPFLRGTVKPYSESSATVTIRIQRGERPKRLYDTQRRISDRVWELMETCWAADPRSRPPINQIVRVVGTQGIR